MGSPPKDGWPGTDPISDLRRSGCALFRGALPATVLAEVRDALASVVDKQAEEWLAEGWISDSCPTRGFEERYAALREQLPPRFSNIWRRVVAHPAIWRLWQRPELLEPVCTVVGAEVYAHGIWSARPRTHHDSQQVPWHQDAHYYFDYDPADEPLVTCWIPLVPVAAADGAMEVVPGSRRLGMVDPLPHGDGQRTVDPAVIDGLAAGGHAVVTCEMEPGDVLMFDACTLHRARPKTTPGVRWSIDIRFARREVGLVKGGPGYVCAGAGPIGTYEEWRAQYDYDGNYFLGADDRASAEAAAGALGVPLSELTEF